PIEVVTDQGGHFEALVIDQGTYEVEASRIGYAPMRQRVEFSAEPAPAVEFRLEPHALPSPVVEVTTTRAEERASAVAFSELDRDKIQEKYWAQDVPMLLSELPGVYAYSDA